MTTKERINTALIRAIVENYSMTEGDITALLNGIRQQITVVYRQTVQSKLTLHSCQRPVSGPDSTSLTWIEEKALKDARGIATTYQRELENKVQSLYLANKKGNRNYYSSNLNTWFAARSIRKSREISLNTMTQARSYAQDRFNSENNIKGRFAPVGPPPVCIKCVRIFARGPLTWAQCRGLFPAHGGCPHKHEALAPQPINCAEAWTG